ncbi:TetR/AcrR family transcriptional regulator [Serratia sp. M24T3]|uniref:TetR/AcrR family transcriptional regulator n=1 Tax=Serratia sp. M24T3 TaxID=932213 RepID=UPI00025BC386|nr:TetR/AcrR family transcriptional regulator [Serratia sp. M24T3]EIC85104.1 TetR family transcriptional regulator [Serratia sp. M24T3]
MYQANEPYFQPLSKAILTEAIKVFYQFGYKKCSMEDIATAAKVSRQTLHLYFRNKEQLFRAALEIMTHDLLIAIQNVADNQNGAIEDILSEIFDVLCGKQGAVSSAANIAELMAVAHSKERHLITRFQAKVQEILANALTRAGIDTHWQQHGISAQDLALHLLDTSAGIKSLFTKGDDSNYLRRMAIAIRVVVIGAR